jgi:hypothetical protein
METHVRLRPCAAAVEVCVPSEDRVVVGTYALLSVAEVFVSTHHHVNAGTEVIVRLELPSGMIRAEGMVVAPAPSANLYGFTVVFEEVLPLDRERIAAATGNAA